MSARHMRAVVRDEYGPPEVLRLADVAMPVPTDDQVLIKIRAVSINGSDREGLVGKPLRMLVVPQNRKDLIAITELCIAGKVAPVIDKTFRLSDAAEAMAYVTEGKAKEKVVLVVGD